MQSKPLKFNPICGTEFKTDECFAGTFRTGSVRQWFFNPWTGTERATADVKSDPHGLLIVSPGEDCRPFDAAYGLDRCLFHPRYSTKPFCPDCRAKSEKALAENIRDPKVLAKARQYWAAVGDTPAAAREALHDAAEKAIDSPSFPYLQNKPETAAGIANGVADAMFGQSPARAQATGLAAVLADRGAKYGKFDRHAVITQHLKRIMYTYKDRKELADDQVEALDMIAHKIGRILNGDPNYTDSWIDIAGYAKLVADRLDGVTR